MRNIGYIRLSPMDKDIESKQQAMLASGVDSRHIYIDKVTDKGSKLPNYQKMLSTLQPDDSLFIPGIYCLGDTYDDIIHQWKLITEEKKADIVVMDAPMLDTRQYKKLMGNFLSEVILSVLSCVARNENRKNELLRFKNTEAISVAKKKGVKFGTPVLPVPENFEKIVSEWNMGNLSIREAADRCGMPKSTFYEKAKKYLLAH